MRKKLLAAAALVLLLTAAVAAWRLLSRPPEQEQAQALLAAAWSEAGYGFQAQAQVELEDAVSEYFDLQGRVEGDNSQVSGVVLGQEVELRYHDGLLRRRLGDGAWSEHAVADLGSAGELYAELLPQAAFAYQGVDAYACAAQEGGWALTLTPRQALGWVGQYFRDVRYVLYCDRWGRELRALELRATEKINGQAGLVLRVTLED